MSYIVWLGTILYRIRWRTGYFAVCCDIIFVYNEIEVTSKNPDILYILALFGPSSIFCVCTHKFYLHELQYHTSSTSAIWSRPMYSLCIHFPHESHLIITSDVWLGILHTQYIFVDIVFLYWLPSGIRLCFFWGKLSIVPCSIHRMRWHLIWVVSQQHESGSFPRASLVAVA